MVKSFGISDEDTGYYAGVIASSMFLGRTLGCYFWGWLTDKIGRRPVILISLVLTIIGMASFGLSVSLTMAIITRFFVGLTNGVIGTAKAIVSEISDDTNQALAVSVILTAWNMGLIVGPGIGGYLAEPVQKYSSVFTEGSFFDKFAFFLPCLFNCGILLISFVLTYFLLPETLVKSESEASAVSEIGELALQSTISSVDNQEDCNQQRLLVDSDKTCEKNSSSQEAEELEIFVRDADSETKEDGRNCCGCKSWQCTRYGCCRCFRNSKIAVLLRTRSTMIAIAVYCVYSFIVIGFDELFSLWAATQAENGGLGFSTNQIGTALLCVAAPLLFLQMWTYPKFERRLGAKRVFQLVNAIVGILTASLSAINTYYDRSTVLWPLLIGILLPLKLGVGCGFSSTVILVNNSVPSELLGSVNGLAMTASSICRTLAPLFAGSVFAWSISKGYKHGFPLDEHLTFLLLSVVCLLCILFSCMLPKGLNSRKAGPVRV
ncbi:probable peptide/nitrate transporter At3g43790 isoform X2 [Orbicella faveolata]|nr:probable peptide/nitrate transporter At3g43790 isoform X2 [Orbicella faveolata]